MLKRQRGFSPKAFQFGTIGVVRSPLRFFGHGAISGLGSIVMGRRGWLGLHMMTTSARTRRSEIANKFHGRHIKCLLVRRLAYRVRVLCGDVDAFLASLLALWICARMAPTCALALSVMRFTSALACS
jgi:hypothetical protein